MDKAAPTSAESAEAIGTSAEDLDFLSRYGPWSAFSPAEAASFFAPIGIQWWIAGGWAIEAFTGVPREHEDIDVSIFRRDIPALRRACEGRYHLWSAGSGSLRPVTDRFPLPPDDSDQIWLREHALAPWKADVVLNPDEDGRWVSRRDPTYVADLEVATWECGGIRYLRPEIVLSFKALLARPKDERDFSAALPLLDDAAVAWLADYLRRCEPEHPWRARL